MIKALLLLLSLTTSSVVLADVEFPVSMLTNQVQDSTSLGKTQIDGLGEVKLVARKQGTQLVIHATDAQGIAIGKAETVVGLKETPIYVSTAQGLKRIVIKWGAGPGIR